MRGKNRMVKRRNRICRRIAVALTVALLIGQSHAFVLAEEGANDVPTTEISDETKTDVEARGEETPEEILEDDVSGNGDEIEEAEDPEEPEPPAETTYTVTIHVQKNGGDWAGHDRSFALSSDDGVSMETDLNAVKAGTYNVFDITGESNINTGVSIDVGDGEDKNTATVVYYTVTFCDEDGTEYGNDTILANVGRLTKPTDPVKAGYTFDGWVTEEGGATPFNFDEPITRETKIYAKWTENTVVSTYKVTIKVIHKDGKPWDNHKRKFGLIKGDGTFLEGTSGKAEGSTYQIEGVPNGTYTIYDVTGVPEESLYSKAVDTGIRVRVEDGDTNILVTVDGADVEVTDDDDPINYYTVTFYAGDIEYETQIILNGKQVVRPAVAPSKTGYTFDKWVTENDGRTEFDFDTPIEKPTSIYASWKEGADDPDPVKDYTITATAEKGGTINPSGRKTVPEGGSMRFTIEPSEGYRIEFVIVDGVPTTETIKEADNVYTYTFTNVKENHTIRVTFESDGSNPGSGDGDNSGGGDHGNSGSGNGDHGNSGGGNGDSGNGDAGNSNGGDSDGGSSDGGDNAGGGNSAVSNLSAGSAAAGGNSAAGSNSDGAVSGGSTGSKEPKTGDASQAEVYATIAMIAGLTYLLLYVMEEGRGMSEQEKDELVAAFVRWAKKGGAFRRCCAMVAIFCVLAYYHSIGKRIGGNALNEKYLGQLS